MAGGKFSEALLHGMTIRESANDGSDFTNPAADYRRVFLGEDGEWHSKDSAGSVAGFAGSGIAATIMAAKGDILGASANDTPAITTAGANGTVPTYQSGQATGILPQFPPGYELDYVEKTSGTTITATTDAGADTVISSTSQAYANEAINIEFYCPEVFAAASDTLHVTLWEDSTNIGRLAEFFSSTHTDNRIPMLLRRRRTPTGATHQYHIKAFMGAGQSVQLNAGAGGVGTLFPAYIRITKV